MAYNGMYSGYGNNFFQQQNEIANLQNQYNQLRAMQSQIQSPIPNQNQSMSQGILQIGTYVVVKTIQDMENYGVPVDGTPVNIFIENMGVFYSKKMSNGTTTCQPFSFTPLNASKTNDSDKVEQSIDETPAWAENLLERVVALEKKSVKKTKKVEDEENGI